MRRLSALDHMVQNFQHKWETNPQFRATVSGGLGIAIVVMLCACLGVAFTFSSSIATAVSGSNTTLSNTDAVVPNGTAKVGSVDNTLTFPTQTPGQVTSAQIPQAQLIPPSLTPQPTPTAQPTPTPLPTAPPGTGGGGGGGGCGNCTVTVTGYSLSHSSSTGSVTVHTSKPNAQVNIFVQSPWVSPTNPGSTDASGNGTIPIPGVSCSAGAAVSLWIKTDISGSTSYVATCS